MRGLKEKLRKDSGFTLIEMLIVVSIIAILIAVSVPMVNSALDRVRHATDAANERAAKAAAVVYYLTGDAQKDLAPGSTNSFVRYYYDAVNGTIVKQETGDKKPADAGCVPYGKCIKDGHKDCYLWVMLHLDTFKIHLGLK